MNPENVEKKTISELSVDAQILIKRLKKAAVGEVITYEELSKEIGRDVQGKVRYLLETARKHLMNNDRILFDAVFGKGLKRIQGPEIISVGSRAVVLIRHAARRCAKKLGCISDDDYAGLKADDQRRFNGLLAISATVSHVTKEHQVQAVSAAATEKISLQRTLEMFTKK